MNDDSAGGQVDAGGQRRGTKQKQDCSGSEGGLDNAAFFESEASVVVHNASLDGREQPGWVQGAHACSGDEVVKQLRAFRCEGAGCHRRHARQNVVDIGGEVRAQGIASLADELLHFVGDDFGDFFGA